MSSSGMLSTGVLTQPVLFTCVLRVLVHMAAVLKMSVLFSGMPTSHNGVLSVSVVFTGVLSVSVVFTGVPSVSVVC